MEWPARLPSVGGGGVSLALRTTMVETRIHSRAG